MLPIISKIFHRVLLERIKKGIDKKLKKEQASFRPNGNTTEQIFTLKKHLRAGKRLEGESAHALCGLLKSPRFGTQRKLVEHQGAAMEFRTRW